ncbi:hypothetical protein GCM10027035_11410 [Emticicia sediminis]
MTDHSVLLKERITFLEDRQSREIVLLKEQVHVTYESLKPMNFLKDTIEEFTSQPNLKKNIFDGIASISTGYLSKKLFVGTSNNPVKKLAGTLFQVAVTTLVAGNSDKLKAIGEVFLKHLLGRETIIKDDDE